MELARVIHTMLNAGDVKTYFDSRIYPDILKQQFTLPAITFTVNNITRTGHKTNQVDYDEADITITIYTKTRGDAERYSYILTNQILRTTTTVNNTEVLGINHTGENWDVWDRQDHPGSSGIGAVVYLQVINFQIAYKYTYVAP